MSDKFERVQLNEEQEELVAGGKLVVVSGQYTGYYLYPKGNEENRYDFAKENLRSVKVEIDGHPDASDDELIQLLLGMGLIYPHQ